MEYFELGDLGHCVTAALPEDESQMIVAQITEALHFMHQRNIAHRDLKPSVSPRLCLADFPIDCPTERLCCSANTYMVGESC